MGRLQGVHDSVREVEVRGVRLVVVAALRTSGWEGQREVRRGSWGGSCACRNIPANRDAQGGASRRLRTENLCSMPILYASII